MVRATLAAVAALAGAAFAAPITESAELAKRANIDYTVLQFALTLEHLENYFYNGALKKLTLQDFTNAGYSADYYHNLHYIAYDEQTHVQALEAALKAGGQTPVVPCKYDFPYSDVTGFITLSSIIENVGTSAYLGAAPLITSPSYLTVAGAILAVEALHTSYQRAAVGEVPMENPFQTPISPSTAFTLATMFITSCPSSNPNLGFTQFPYLATNNQTCQCEQPDCGAPSQYIKEKRDNSGWSWPGPGGWHPNEGCRPPVAGTAVTFTATGKIPTGSYVTFVNGLTVSSVKGTIKGDEVTAKVPTGLAGQTYVFVTKTAIKTYSDSAILFGPAILEVRPAQPVIDYSQTPGV